MTPEQIARFWSKVDRSGECWTWTASRRGERLKYGRVRIGERDRAAHRVAWELANGPIPDGMFILHRCDRPTCVRPDHLFLGSIADNNRDARSKGRHAFGARHGHAVLTDLTVREIRQAVAGGALFVDLAARYGVSAHSVSDAAKGRTWRHVA